MDALTLVRQDHLKLEGLLDRCERVDGDGDGSAPSSSASSRPRSATTSTRRSPSSTRSSGSGPGGPGSTWPRSSGPLEQHRLIDRLSRELTDGGSDDETLEGQAHGAHRAGPHPPGRRGRGAADRHRGPDRRRHPDGAGPPHGAARPRDRGPARAGHRGPGRPPAAAGSPPPSAAWSRSAPPSWPSWPGGASPRRPAGRPAGGASAAADRLPRLRSPYTPARRSGRAAEGSDLESRRTREGPVGSNPTSSALLLRCRRWSGRVPAQCDRR